MKNVVIVGAGAAGYFAAIACAEAGASVQIIEATGKTLAKVRVSGGGRCNVTNACCDPKELVGYYPRGGRELLGPFHHIGPAEIMDWFEYRGVALITEADGRVFPQSHTSQTIIDCFHDAAEQSGVRLALHQALKSIAGNQADGFQVHTAQKVYAADAIICATGSSRTVYGIMEGLGHHIVPPLPSLFTFKCAEKKMHALSGLSVAAVEVTLAGLPEPYVGTGPLMITHWGFSGPAILKASAWAARSLAAVDYRCTLQVNWLPAASMTDIIKQHKQTAGGQRVYKAHIEGLPQRLWLALIQRRDVGITEEQTWAQLSQAAMQALQDGIHRAQFCITGKAVFKEEFVTAGGIAREEINWKRMESTCCPGLHFAGECIDVDALTGGFNFQNAWTSASLAARACCE